MPPFRKYAWPMDARYRAWPRRIRLFEAMALYLLACVGALLSSFLPALLRSALPGLSDGHAAEIASALVEIALMFYPCVRLIQQSDGVNTSMRLVPAPSDALFIAVILGIAAAFLAQEIDNGWRFILRALGARAGLEPVYTISSGWTLVRRIIVYALTPAISEELLMHGVVMTSMERRGSLFSLFATAFLFANLHGSFSLWPVQFLMGLLFGCMTILSGSLFSGIVCHLSYNATILFASGRLSANLSGVGNAVWILGFTAVLFGGLCAMLACRKYRRWPSTRIVQVQQPLRMDSSTMLVLISALTTGMCQMLVDALVLFGGV